MDHKKQSSKKMFPSQVQVGDQVPMGPAPTWWTVEKVARSKDDAHKYDITFSDHDKPVSTPAGMRLIVFRP